MSNIEKIAYWFFRVNGCLTIEDFVMHPNSRGSQRTDADILAVRFPYRLELRRSHHPLIDHPVFNINEKIILILAEIKTGLTSINQPWKNPELDNIPRLLDAIGLFPDCTIPDVAESLYQNFQFENEMYSFRLFSIGDRKNRDLPANIIQLTWSEILIFLHQRFCEYHRIKAHHPQWDPVGQLLFRSAWEADSPDDYVTSILKYFKHQE